MPSEVSAAAKPPQTTPLYIGIRVDTREGNGECRRRRAVMPLPRFLSHLSHLDGLNVRIAPRRAGGNNRRSRPACPHECLYRGRLSTAILPPPRISAIGTPNTGILDSGDGFPINPLRSPFPETRLPDSRLPLLWFPKPMARCTDEAGCASKARAAGGDEVRGSAARRCNTVYSCVCRPPVAWTAATA